MDKLIKRLREYGANIDGVRERFLGDMDLYKTCFTAFLADEAFRELGEALAAADYDKAFEHAHTLKGVAGNMGLMPMYKVICSMVEDLRKNEHSNLQGYYAEVEGQLEELKKF